ncbi:MAG: alpha/beta hydrolase family protein [Planctomycetes bacterium]|nr:alpha/beta hydrolase family protein [Planctomycetota bacterium]
MKQFYLSFESSNTTSQRKVRSLGFLKSPGSFSGYAGSRLVTAIVFNVLLIGPPLLRGEQADADEKLSEANFVSVPQAGKVSFHPTAAESRVPERFRQTAHTFSYETEYERNSGPVRVFKVRFPSPIKTEHDENNTVHGHYFQPQGEGPFPGVVVLHILGGQFPMSQMIANSLARKGIAALFIKLPYYGERRSTKSRMYMVMTDPKLTAANMTQGVADIRRAASWLGERPEVDENQLGLTGISLGGIMSALAAPAEPRFQKVAIHLGGGNLILTMWDQPHYASRWFRKQWEERGGTRESLREIIKPVDPITYAHLIKDRTVLMVAAKHDEIVLPESTIALWEKMDKKPKLVWLDAGHISALTYLYGEVHRLTLFFQSDKRSER